MRFASLVDKKHDVCDDIKSGKVSLEHMDGSNSHRRSRRVRANEVGLYIAKVTM